nr:S8 family peptidase [Mycoplasmopsis bovis]
MINFNGTSKPAPMITGIISRIQSKLQKELSIEDVKLMLVSSATYSKTKASGYSSSSFSEITSTQNIEEETMLKTKLVLAFLNTSRWNKFEIVEILEELGHTSLAKIL